jgi:choice-of-anchor A domain-containing protein
MLSTSARSVVFGGIALLAPVLFVQGASAATFNLGAAGGFALLELGEGATITDTDQANIGGGNTINGNIGIGNGANLNNSDPATVTKGNIFVSTGATFSTGGTVNGSTFTNQNLSQARTDALSLSTSAAGLSNTGTISNPNTTQTIAPGVYSFTSLQLNNNNAWTLSGAGSYIFNISTSLSVDHFTMNLTNGATASQVLFNFTGTTALSLTNGSVLAGIILAPNAAINFNGGSTSLLGELISGEDINIASHAVITNPVPLPAALPLFASGVGALGLLGWRRKRKAALAAA